MTDNMKEQIWKLEEYTNQTINKHAYSYEVLEAEIYKTEIKIAKEALSVINQLQKKFQADKVDQRLIIQDLKEENRKLKETLFYKEIENRIKKCK